MPLAFNSMIKASFFKIQLQLASPTNHFLKNRQDHGLVQGGRDVAILALAIPFPTYLEYMRHQESTAALSPCCLKYWLRRLSSVCAAPGQIFDN